MKKVLVRAAVKGQLCKHPNGAVVRDKGVELPRDAFTLRRIADSSLVEVESKAETKPQVKGDK